MVNVLRALLNMALGYSLFRVGKVSTGDYLGLVVFSAGILAISIMGSLTFAKKETR